MTHLADYVATAAAKFPDRTALADPDGRICRYGELVDRYARVARFLHEAGIGAGDRVAILLPKTIEAVTTILGTLAAGAAYVPADWTAPLARTRAIFSDCGVRALFVAPGCLDILDEWPQETQPHHVVVVSESPVPANANPRLHSWPEVLRLPASLTGIPVPKPDDLAYLLYTSGSTGVPKGVVLSQRNATSFVDWCSETFRPLPEDHFSSHAPFHFDLSVLDLYLSLKHGATLHLIPDELGKNPKELALYIAQRNLSVWYSTPSVLSLLAQFGGLERLPYRGPRLALFAGEVFPVKHLRKISTMWPAATWYNLYGPTETNVCTFARVPTPIPEDRTEPYPIGELCSHCRGVVLADDGSPAPPGGEGLLHIAGPSVCQGYWNREEETAKAFRSIGAEQFYNTGDVVRVDPVDGLVYVGRKDRMVKRRGYRIELGEIESALYRHAGLRQVAVVAMPDPQLAIRIVACLVAEGVPPGIIELKQFCQRNLPAYMSPDVFRYFDSLPRTSTDKTDYQHLARLLAAES